MINLMKCLLVVVFTIALMSIGYSQEVVKSDDSATTSTVSKDDQTTKTAEVKLPKMVELGSVGCIPCKMMAPIVEELTTELKGVVDFEFIDVNKFRDKAEQYKVRVIPLQVFLDEDGKEVFRHEGFFPKEEILKVLNEKLNVKTNEEKK